jgi:hypothetical protein
MKTKVSVFLVTFFMALLIAMAARADDAAITKQLIGRWKSEGGRILVFRPDGTSAPDQRKWKVHDGVLIIEINPNRNDEGRIISLTKDKLVIQDLFHGHGTGTWTRIAAGH